MTTIAQDTLKTFEDSRLTILSSVIDLNYLIQYEKLKVEALQEIEANRIESEQVNETTQITWLNTVKAQLTALGFVLDNGKLDWDKLYNKPYIYGSNWEVISDYERSKSPNIDYFVHHAYYLMNSPYQVNNHYYTGDRFIYEDILYEVIQEHTSQLDWIPSSTPALYKKGVAEGVIPDWVQPTGGHDAYNIGNKVKFNNLTYESLINANVWSPAVYPAGWKLI